MCVDFRGLNKKTIPDCHPLPCNQDLLDNLGGYSWFSILNQGSAYHQGFVEESSRHPTALSTPGDYMSGYASHLALTTPQQHFKDVWRESWMVLGLSVVPHTWMMCCFSKTVHDHLDDLRQVLCRLREHGVKLCPKKCELF